MPKSLKVHSGQRVDLVDYVHGANTFTKETEKFVFERTWLDRRARILDGFRVKVEDQTAFPGMVTVYNGNALDREGQLINNEQSVDDSRSVTLLGAGLTFYLEIEFSENVSDTDARFFWDPTQPNTAPALPGSEFSLNVATRVTPDWRVVTPVSTTGYSTEVDPNSRRIPLMALRTDGSNRITDVSTPGLELVSASTVLENRRSAGAEIIKVIDARIFPSTLPFDIDIGVGSSSVERRTVTAVDKDNGTFTVSVPLTHSHPEGAIVRDASGGAFFVKEKTDPGLTIQHPDLARRFWQAAEERGAALASSKETYGERDDLNLRSLKDYVDFMAGQLRELKFGDPDPDTQHAAPPKRFGFRPRYFDRAGSVQGARTNTVSVGNGTTSFGDFNGTTGAALAAAIDALPTAGGTVFVKEGTYDIIDRVEVTKDVIIVGESKSSVLLNVDGVHAGSAIVVEAGSLSLQNVTAKTTTPAQVIGAKNSTQLVFRDSTIIGQIGLQGNVAVYAENSTFTTTGTMHNHIFFDGVLRNAVFYGCEFESYTGSAFRSRLNTVTIDGCDAAALEFIGYQTGGQLSAVALTNLAFVGISLVSCPDTVVFGLRLNGVQAQTTLDTDEALIKLGGNDALVGVVVDGLMASVIGGPSQASSPAYIFHMSGDAIVQGLRLANVEVRVASGANVKGAYVSSKLQYGIVENSVFYGTSTLAEFIGVDAEKCSLKVIDCVHDNVGNSVGDVVGVHLGSGARFKNVEVRGCTFLDYTNTSGTDAQRIGVLVDNVSTDLAINGCRFYDLTSVGPRESAGIRAVLTGNASSTVVDNCEFRNISGASPGHDSYGAYVQSVGFVDNSSVHITNSTIMGVGADNLSVRSAGLYVRSAEAVIGNNRVVGVIGNGDGGFVSGIHLADAAEHAKIHANDILHCRSEADVSSTSIGAGVRILVDLAQSIDVSHNTIRQEDGPGTAYGVIVYGGASRIQNVLVEGNTVAARRAGIAILRAAANSTIQDVVIGKNEVTIGSRQVSEPIGVGIECLLGDKSKNINIQGNVVKSTYNGPSQGILVEGAALSITEATSNVNVSNNTMQGPITDVNFTAPETHVGIAVSEARSICVSNNVVAWTYSDAYTGTNIRVWDSWVSLEGVSIVGNVVTNTNTDTVRVGTTNKRVMVANNVFTTDTASPIWPASPEPGWMYSNNLIG